MSSVDQTILRVPEKAAGKKRIKRTPTALPEIMASANKLFKKTPWMALMIRGFTISLTLLVPAFSIWLTELIASEKGKTWYENLSSQPDIFEIFRWSLLLALFSFAYYMANTLFTLCPIIFKRTPKTLRRFGLALGSLRTPLALFFAALVMLIVFLRAGLDVPSPPFDEKKLEAESDAQEKYLLFQALNVFLRSMMSHLMVYKDKLLAVPYILLFVFTVILFEKICILKINNTFHRNLYTRRILDNNLVVSCFEALAKRFPNPNEAPVKAGELLTTERISAFSQSIFEGLCEPGRDVIILDDFMAVMDHPVAVKLMQYVDFNKSDDITLEELTVAIIEAYEEKRNLEQTIAVNEKVLENIDNFFVTVILLFKASMLLPRISVSWVGVLAYFFCPTFALSFAFDHVLNQLYESVIHFMVTHPYDIGDKIKLGDKVYRVIDMGFWKTTLALSCGRITYVANHTMCEDHFGNYRRSDPQDETMSMVVAPTTPKEDVEAFLKSFNAFVLENGRYFEHASWVKKITIDSSASMTINFAVKHRLNFQNDKGYRFRREFAYKNACRIAKENNLKLIVMRYIE